MIISAELRCSSFGFLLGGVCILVSCILNGHTLRTVTEPRFTNGVDNIPLSFLLAGNGKERSVFKTYDLVIVHIVALSKKSVTMNIETFGHIFNLYLKQDTSAFHPSARIIVNSGPKTKITNSVELDYLFTGKDVENPYSYAEGAILSGSFDGTIHTSSETFYVEPAERYLTIYGPLPEFAKTPHLVYRHADIIWNKTISRKSTVDSLSTAKYFTDKFPHHPPQMTGVTGQDTRYHSGGRKTRAANSPVSCTLKVVVDHLFFEYIGGSDVSKTVAEIAILAKETDDIFRSTDFNGDGVSDNLGLVITDLTLYTHKNTPGYKLGGINLDDTEYLELFSEYDFNSFCMAVSFTYRDFPDGVIGLAWVASSNWHSYPGGICQHRIHTSSKYYSFNTAMVSYLNHEDRMPRAKAISTFVHELGHSFGSPHDIDGDPICSPGGELGNFLMYPFTLDGTKPNHERFSSCSVSNIYPVIINKGTCLISHPGPVCGNGVIETGEQCDCGTSTSCHVLDHCCTPADHPISSPDIPCTVRTSVGYACSPIASPCCDYTCHILSAVSNYSCLPDLECSLQSMCDGFSPLCPKPGNKPNGTLCSENRRFCLAGECQSSLCQSFGLMGCLCSEHIGLCSVCCFSPTATCIHISKFNISTNYTGNFLALSGQPCNSYRGYCDAGGNCVLVDTDSTIERLVGMFGKDAAERVQHWLSLNWFYVLLGFATLFLLVGLFWANYRCQEKTDILAKRTGKLLILLKEAKRQKEAIHDNLLKIENMAENKRYTKFDKVIAVSRLMMLFPDLSSKEANTVTLNVTDEETAVRYLLMRRHALITILTMNNKSNYS